MLYGVAVITSGQPSEQHLYVRVVMVLTAFSTLSPHLVKTEISVKIAK